MFVLSLLGWLVEIALLSAAAARFFDHGQWVAGSAAVAYALGGVAVTVFIVCRGYRQDRSPERVA
ncbi:MAG: hypothetical protein HY566_01570 [Candidatus Kerfeldbacteria bacterium]|nr:hypothetical protein [Candidatus Kerfeldbacteria bacterium]